LLCSGVNGNKSSIAWLHRVATDRRPDGILFAGGILSQERQVVPRSASPWGLTLEDERFASEFLAALGSLGIFSAVIPPGANFQPEDDFFRISMAAELEFPSLHLVHATLVEAHDLAICGLGVAITEQPLMREDAYTRVKALYFLRCMRTSRKPRKVLLLADAPPGVLGGPHGNIVIGELIDGLKPNLCVVAGSTERRGLQRIASTLVVNPGHLTDGSAAWLDWDRSGDDQVEFLKA